MSEPRFHDVYVTLVGQDGNTGAIMARVTRAMSEAGLGSAEQQEFRLAVFECDSYDAVLRLVMETVSVGEPSDYE